MSTSTPRNPSSGSAGIEPDTAAAPPDVAAAKPAVVETQPGLVETDPGAAVSKPGLGEPPIPPSPPSANGTRAAGDGERAARGPALPDLQSVLGYLALVPIAVLSAVLNTHRLAQNNYANVFYSAGVKSMLGSFHNFVFA
jgi:hypothetical protein